MGAPAEAIRDLLDAIANSNVAAKPRYVRDDIQELRRTYPSDADFARAIRAVAERLRRLSSERAVALDHDLAGWWRIKFTSGDVDRADLRIIFRVRDEVIELRAFGHRHDPDSIYRKLLQR